MFAHEINFDWANLIFAAHYCVWGTRTQPLISVGCPVQLISEVFSRSLVSLGSQCPVSMNFCLIFLICNSGHWLIRVVIDIIPCCVNLFFLFNSLWIYLLLVSFFLSPSKKKTYFRRKKKWLRQMVQWTKCWHKHRFCIIEQLPFHFCSAAEIQEQNRRVFISHLISICSLQIGVYMCTYVFPMVELFEATLSTITQWNKGGAKWGLHHSGDGFSLNNDKCFDLC